MYARLVGAIVSAAYRQAVRGEPRLISKLSGNDVVLVFPGSSSFGGEHRGRVALLDWLGRFAALRPTFAVRDVVVSGPPWNLRAAVRFSDAIGEDYCNEGMELLAIRWFKVRRIEVFLDTAVLAAWERRHPELSVDSAHVRQTAKMGVEQTARPRTGRVTG